MRLAKVGKPSPIKWANKIKAWRTSNSALSFSHTIQLEQNIMLDTKAFYSIFKSIIADKAKAEHKPSLSNKASMQAYQQATGSTQKASFNIDQANMVIDYV